jgi:ubiquinone/menaquinone biosynthesis C-methylase UbiE
MREEEQRKSVREGYAKITRDQASSCGCGQAEESSRKMGYSGEELESVPEGANMGLGCGNPVALASLKAGETVVDLGSGGGFDCFLAAKKVGEKGRVIGVDMTPEMLDKARQNARKNGYGNVEFRLGEIENLPVADNTADMVISNCVVNLVPDKKRVYEEAYRVLKPGGRLMVSDIVLLKKLPEGFRGHPASCVNSAVMKDKYLETIEQVGFRNLEILKEERHCEEDVADDPKAKVMVYNAKTDSTELKSLSELTEKQRETAKAVLESTASINVSATKPLKR